ncbi:MAG: tRNA pseudouridine(38-40) synthase TruA [Tannerella sp.]|jgi:tRNA pseudouridine38-40 synthase|nr:tRNA pseudouridine(38-40) synthase TruA [Tannerella sp.]
MNRYFIYLAYSGTAYCGWQRQPNAASVQQRLEEALATALQQPVTLTGAGRTDTGVHARQMVAHFDSVAPLVALDTWTEKLNRMLPQDIGVERILPVREDAHARFDALSRTYQYCLTDRKNPFNGEWVYRMSLRGMNFVAMNEACDVLREYRDFTSFSKLHTDVKTNLCHIYRAGWEREGDIRTFTICADRFLRNMVRAIVGTLFEVGRGKCNLNEFRDLIEAKDRCRAGSSAPAKGLALTDIAYPDSLFLRQEA